MNIEELMPSDYVNTRYNGYKCIFSGNEVKAAVTPSSKNDILCKVAMSASPEIFDS